MVKAKYVVLLLILLIEGKTTSFAQSKLLFLIAGQSNAIGHGDSVLSPKLTKGTALEYRYGTNKLYPLADPVGASELGFEKSNTGSAWPAFSTALFKLTGKQIVIIPAAKGGSSCDKKAELDNYGTWDTTGILFNNAVRKAKAAVTKTRQLLTGIIWLQGERDANAINSELLTMNEYRAALKNLINRFRKSFGDVPFYIIETGYYKDHPTGGFEQVQAVQQQMAAELPDVYLIYKTKQFLAEGKLKDGLHYNQIGLNEIGAKSAEIIFTHSPKK